MGWFGNKQAEMDERLRALIEPLVGSDEQLRGVVYANRQGKMSAKLFAIGVTDRRLIIREVDRKWNPTSDAPLLLTADEIDVGNIFSEGAGWSIGRKDQEIRFTARGEEHRFMVLGGNMVENAFAGDGQLSGLDALVQFLRSTRS